MPVSANEAQNFINDEVAEWTDIAGENGFNVLGSYIGTIDTSGVIYTLDLAPGIYHFYSSGGMYVEDLDLYIYDPDGFLLGSDDEPDKIPIVVIQLAENTTLEVNIDAWSFESGRSSGNFCIVLACDDEGEVYSFTGDTTEIDIDIETPPDIDDEIPDDFYMDEITREFEHWDEYEADEGNEIIDNDIVLVDGPSYRLTYTLDPGFYSVYAQPDSRCSDLDMVVYDRDGVILDDDHLVDNFPICEFLLGERQEIAIELELYSFDEGHEQAYVAYIVSWSGDMDDEARLEYIEEKLENLIYNSEESGEEVIDFGTDSVSLPDRTVSWEFELDAGSYFCEADGGLAITDLNMRVYGEAENILDEDLLDDNYPMVWFELAEPRTVTVVIDVVKFTGGFDDGYFCWILTEQSYEYYDDWDDYDDSYPPDEDELIINAESLAAPLMAVAEKHSEIVIDTFTEPVCQEDLDEGWRYDLYLDEGAYFVYAQGDDICLTDIDMFIENENGGLVDSDEAWYNVAICRIDVGSEGGSYTIVIKPYFLECEVGYFNLFITREFTSSPEDQEKYIENEIAEWTDIADNNNYTVLATYIGEIGSDDVTCTIELEPGIYHFYSSGGLLVEDIDIYIYDQDGRELDSDTDPDKIPILEIELDEITAIDVVITPFSYLAGFNEGLFCLLVTCEDEGEILGFTGDVLEFE